MLSREPDGWYHRDRGGGERLTEQELLRSQGMFPCRCVMAPYLPGLLSLEGPLQFGVTLQGSYYRWLREGTAEVFMMERLWTGCCLFRASQKQ